MDDARKEKHKEGKEKIETRDLGPGLIAWEKGKSSRRRRESVFNYFGSL